MREIKLNVNGTEYELCIESQRTLLEVLREDLGLTGTKEGCGLGECGACTVIINGVACNSCLMLAVEAEGKEVLTIEGLAYGKELHPLQEAFMQEGGLQCGFCTPGMIMSAKVLLDRYSDPTDEEIKQAIAGNLCRCTGYTKILKAIKTAARNMGGG